ncbi:hypothetical protein LGZ99_12445 [Photorhabdus temperata]|uniref:hypothetical protein n=1 Tax=Photorhabdus temperata TaxID=574560 RepID=UPI0021D4C2F0|nr:hypothetical protein [Photorhabdus temperata]MCT8347990.1 hypothetical protein [Photorhabdus temperata]
MIKYSFKKQLIVYHLIFIVLFFPMYYAYANPALLLARPLITRVLQSVITRRAALVAANDAVMLNVVRSNTMRYVGRVAANDSVYKMATVTSLRHAKDVSWIGLALASGAITLSDLNVEGNDKVSVNFEPTAVKLTDGRYAININGTTKVVSYNPSTDNPVIYQYKYNPSNPAEKLDAVESDNLSSDYQYYYKSVTGSFIMSNDISKLAEHKVYNDLRDGGDSEEYETVEIGDKTHRYLKQKVKYTVEYLRKNPNSNILYIYSDVRLTRESTRLKYSFKPITSHRTGKEEIKTFNMPNLGTDYDYNKDIQMKENVSLIVNRDYVDAAKDDLQIGTIADLDLDLYQNKVLPLQSLAKLLNGLMLEAALQQGYDGVPFSQENRVTQAEIQTVLNELGVDKVTFADLMTKAGTDNVININIEEKPAPNPNPNPNPNPRQDPDPDEDGEYDEEDIVYPELDTPTAEDILNPYKSFFPELQNFKLTARNVQCPVWNVPFLGKDYKMDSHCPLIEENRGVFESVFALVWAFIALRKLLSA